jgi:hypothetical protein
VRKSNIEREKNIQAKRKSSRERNNIQTERERERERERDKDYSFKLEQSLTFGSTHWLTFLHSR